MNTSNLLTSPHSNNTRDTRVSAWDCHCRPIRRPIRLPSRTKHVKANTKVVAPSTHPSILQYPYFTRPRSSKRRSSVITDMSFFKSIIPTNPVPRAVSVAALAAAGCAGLFFAAESGVLLSWSLPIFKPWQVLTFTSFGINTLAVFLDDGRLDGPDPQDRLRKMYFMPAGWAFAIWGPIFLGEGALATYQALPLESVTAATGWLARLSPWLASAFLMQCCWCLSFREWARDAGLLWFPASCLGGTAVCLGGAHRVVRGVLAAGKMSTIQYGLVHLPISLHFGWVSCATLVNLNNYVSTLAFSDKAKLNFSLASIAAAVGLAVAVTGSTGDPVYAGVVAWALSAVASKKGWEKLQGKVENWTLERQAVAAKIGAAVCAGTAVATPFILKSIRG